MTTLFWIMGGLCFAGAGYAIAEGIVSVSLVCAGVGCFMFWAMVQAIKSESDRGKLRRRHRRVLRSRGVEIRTAGNPNNGGFLVRDRGGDLNHIPEYRQLCGICRRPRDERYHNPISGRCLGPYEA